MGTNTQIAAGMSPVEGASAPLPMPFVLWIFFRLIVPTAPILIQYSLHWLTGYVVKFPQPAYLTLLFSLPLATLTEYRQLKALIYGCVVPALVACMLYTAHVLEEVDASSIHRIELTAFSIWVILLTMNVIRVASEGIKRWIVRKRTC